MVDFLNEDQGAASEGVKLVLLSSEQLRGLRERAMQKGLALQERNGNSEKREIAGKSALREKAPSVFCGLYRLATGRNFKAAAIFSSQHAVSLFIVDELLSLRIHSQASA